MNQLSDTSKVFDEEQTVPVEAAGTNYKKPAPKRRPWYIKAVAILACLMTAWHIFASFLWIAPYSYVREAIPKDALANYMIPMFGQSWSVFAPEPINGNYSLRVRAEVETNGTLETTPWVDVTATELDRWKTHKFFPPRAAGFAMQQASSYKLAYDRLGLEQKKVLAGGYYKGDDWLQRLEQEIRSKPAAKSVNASTNETRINKIVEEERRTTAFATQVAKSIWGQDVKHVQFEVSRQNVIPFLERNTPGAKKPDAVVLGVGWRAPLVEDKQDEKRFRDVFPVKEALETVR